MIKKSAEIKEQVLTDFKDGAGEISLFHFMNEQEANGMGRLFAKIVIPPGNSIGEHTHQGDMEAYYILKGKALLIDNGQETILEAGDCNLCFDGESHAIKNVGDEDLEYIAIVLYSKQKAL